jgi:vancomycin resistance protein YoaR
MSQAAPVAGAGTTGASIFKALLAATLLTFSVAVALLLTVALYQIIFLSRIYIGVQVMGVEVGGMTRAQAQAALDAPAASYLAFPVSLQYAGQHWTLTARQAGATLDVVRSVDQAYAVGRRGGMVASLVEQGMAFIDGVHIQPVVQYDSGPANLALTQIARAVDRPARVAHLVIQPDLTVQATAAQPGLTVDIDATRTVMHQQATSRNPAPVNLVVRTTQPVVTEVNAARQQAEALLGGPLTLTAHAAGEVRDWSLAPAQLADMLVIAEEIGADGVGRVRVIPDEDKWPAYLEQLAAQVARPPVDARLEIDPNTLQLSVLQASQAGQKLDVQAALQAVTELFAHPSRQLELPVVITPPAVPMEQTASMGFTAVVAEATSYFSGSSDARVHNIQVAASKFHGLVLLPGAVFSFNQYLGPVTAENGFEEGLIIWGDRSAVGIGGGVCQVSTTAFRAAFNGGFDIVERWAHGYRVSWYEIGSVVGLDATIYAPDVDFKFHNDTDHFLLIQTYTDPEAATLTFRFYGTPSNRVVTMDGPLEANVRSAPDPVYQDDANVPKGTTKQVEWARDGVDVTVGRTVTEAGVVIHQDTFVSHYQPWRAMYLVGTGNP